MPAKVFYLDISLYDGEMCECSEKEWGEVLKHAEIDTITEFDNGTQKVTTILCEENMVQRIEVK